MKTLFTEVIAKLFGAFFLHFSVSLRARSRKLSSVCFELCPLRGTKLLEKPPPTSFVITSTLSFLFILTMNLNGWHLSNTNSINDQKLAQQMFTALDAASHAGTNPQISNYSVRSATIIEHGGKEHLFISGNSEYLRPEALHSEVGLVSQIITRFGPDIAKEKIRFIAFYSESDSSLSPCGDCRDYLLANTDSNHLLEVIGNQSDGSVMVRPFKDSLVSENLFMHALVDQLPISKEELSLLTDMAIEARENSIKIFTPSSHHTAAAALSFTGKIYRAVGIEDGAFHYRSAIGSILQQAATEKELQIRAIVLVGDENDWPILNYRERQYGFEFSGYAERNGHDPICVILTDRAGNYRYTSFGESLPNAFRLEYTTLLFPCHDE